MVQLTIIPSKQSMVGESCKSRPVSPSLAHADVDALGEEIDGPRVGVQQQIHRRIPALEPIDARQQPLRWECRTDRHGEREIRRRVFQLRNAQAQAVEPSRMSGSARGAASVSTRRAVPLAALMKSGAPGHDSRLRTNWPTAAGVTLSSSAAAEKLWWGAAASKALSAFR